MSTPARTRLAVLGTLSDLHREPIAYDLARLRSLAADLAPDLLCAEVTREAWERSELSAATLEVREALAPVAAATDIVILPVLPTVRRYSDFSPAEPRKRSLVRAADRLLRWGQRQANSPEAISGPAFGGFCHTVCWLTEALWTAEDRAAWEAQNEAMADNILRAVQRDPGRRVLVAVQCQRLHRLVPLLKAHPELLEIVGYQEL